MMSTGRIQYPENFVRDAASQWRCQRCIDTPVQMTSWRAAEHEKTAKHERAVKRYIDGLNAANRSESAPSGVHSSTSGNQYATNPFMDAFHDAVMAQPPRPRVSTRRSPPDSPPVPDFMDIDDNLPACVPTFARGENRRIRAAVDSALKAYLDSSVIDGSDTDESGGDIDERPMPVYTQDRMGSRRHRGHAKVGTGAWRPWPDRTVSISVTVVLQR